MFLCNDKAFLAFEKRKVHLFLLSSKDYFGKMCYLIRKRKIANEKIITLCVIIFLKEGDYSLKTLIFAFGSEISGTLCIGNKRIKLCDI